MTSSLPKTHGGARPGAGRKPKGLRQAHVRPYVPVADDAEAAAIEALPPAERARRLLVRPLLRATGPEGAWVEVGVEAGGAVCRGHHPAGMTPAQMQAVGAVFALLTPTAEGAVALGPVIAALEGAGYTVQSVEV